MQGGGGTRIIGTQTLRDVPKAHCTLQLKYLYYAYLLYRAIMQKSHKQLSKFLSYVLRHHPETIGLQLDEHGWVDIEELQEKAAAHDVALDQESLYRIVATNPKQRFAYQNHKIRASQGHSIAIDTGYVPQQPPEVLFHGTTMQALPNILETGIEKKRQTTCASEHRPGHSHPGRPTARQTLCVKSACWKNACSTFPVFSFR